MTSVVIADGHRVVSRSLRALIEAEEDMTVLAEVADCPEVVPAVE